MPTWLVVAIWIIWSVWSIVEVLSFWSFVEHVNLGHKLKYTRLAAFMSMVWIVFTIAWLCYRFIG